jgi:hypothetical protein
MILLRISKESKTSLLKLMLMEEVTCLRMWLEASENVSINPGQLVHQNKYS